VPAFFPKTRQIVRQADPATQKVKLSLGAQAKQFLDLGDNRAAAWTAILGTSLTLFAASHLISSYGQWLFVEYGLASAELGRIAGILGLGGFAAIILISTAGDRFGALAGAKIGALVSAFSYLLLPLLNRSVNWFVIGLFIVFFFYQFAMVNAIILTSAQIPAQRGKMMTLGAALGTMGISLANFTGPPAFAAFGAWGLALPSGLTMLVLWLILMRFSHAGPESQ
jgi:predicted MFS family arabinose efflux permease